MFQVDDLKSRISVNDNIDEKLKMIETFNTGLAEFNTILQVRQIDANNIDGLIDI